MAKSVKHLLGKPKLEGSTLFAFLEALDRLLLRSMAQWIKKSLVDRIVESSTSQEHYWKLEIRL